jgi:uncharacterized protein YukE
MSTIAVNYAALADGREGLIATWNRIEGHLAELDARVAATSDMEAQTLAGYRALKARWDAAAQDRQQTLQALANHVGRAGEQYRSVDAAMAAQFG